MEIEISPQENRTKNIVIQEIRIASIFVYCVKIRLSFSIAQKPSIARLKNMKKVYYFLLQRRSPSDNIQQFVSNSLLAGFIILNSKGLNKIVRIIRSYLHCYCPCRVF